MVRNNWFADLPGVTRREISSCAFHGRLHPDPSIASESIEWARTMRIGGRRYNVVNVLVIVVESVFAFFGWGTLGEESTVSDRLAAKRIVRIADRLGR